ncbi:hypothetical protein PENANT_c004G05319 [Penicillium antarcticum]|uniref:Structure-specific endonuclease subunit SLX1 C-terminal domain-containing protein n=1 Tax=Penicillium antarcticum TaxID=416450 RepID=A0A1V6QGL6_9EURO|nr:hypothetical protein PENANT_c004G05319 [Penicillium antarcticum]
MSRRWAWQHPERSRHLGSEDELDPNALAKTNINPKTGKPKAKPRARVRRSLMAHLEDLHSLLRSSYFSVWPLRVRFFRADVYRVWRAWSDRVNGHLPPNIKIILDGDNLGTISAVQKGNDLAPVGGVTSLSVDYTELEDYLEKSMFILEDPEDLHCKCCDGPVSPDEEQIVVCPEPDCRGTSHILCLSTKFLDATNDLDRLTPVQGTCPACSRVVQWPVMMKELSCRNRAEKEARAIITKKEKRLRKEAKASSGSQTSPLKFRSQRTREPTEEPAEDDLGPDWYKEVDLESDSDFDGRQKSKTSRSAPKLDIVIEDSDWDDAEVVE